MKHLAIGLLLLLPLAAQAFTLEEWHTWQADTPAFQSRIEQSRWLDESEIRVHASGQLQFTPSGALIWHWQTPQPRIVELDTAGRFRELSASGAEATLTPLADNDDGLPDERQVGMLLHQALRGDLRALRARYHLLLSGSREAWRLVLLPRETGAGIAYKVSIEGGRFIDRLAATTPSGNDLQLKLLDQRRQVDAAGAKQLQRARRDEMATAPRDDDDDDDDEQEDEEDDEDDD